jgi:HEPN domain-containing protein
MVDELRKAEVVRDRLEGLNQIARSYPEGHDMRVLLENLHLDRALRAVEEDIETLRDALLHPGGT